MKFFQKYSKWIIAFVFACAVIFVYKAFDNISNIFSLIGWIFSALKPFFIGFIIAYILNMPAMSINRLLKKTKKEAIVKHSYGISVGITYFIGVLILIILFAAILPALYQNIIEIYDHLPEYVRAVEGYINNIEILKRLNIIGENGVDIYSAIFGYLRNVDIMQFGRYAYGLISVTSGVFDGIIALIASIYMLIDKDRLIKLCSDALHFVFKLNTAESIVNHAVKINSIFVNYIYCRLICGIITGIFAGIALSILQVKYALLLAILIALLDMIPYFGSIISCVVSVFVALITGGIWKAVWSAIVLIVLQQIDGNILGPKIMGDSLEIRPFWIVFAVSFGGGLFGFWGMLISVPVAAAIKVTFMEYMAVRDAKRDEQEITGTADDDSDSGGGSE